MSQEDLGVLAKSRGEGKALEAAGFSSESPGPGNVAMTCGVESVATLGKYPSVTVVSLAKSEVIRGDVLLTTGESFGGGCELVHETKAEVVLPGGKVYGGEQVRVRRTAV